MNKNYIYREDQSYNATIDSIHAARRIERKLKRVEEFSAFEMKELRRMDEEGLYNPQERQESNEHYKRNLEEQIKLQNEKRAILERAADEYRAYEERRRQLVEQLRQSDLDKHSLAELDRQFQEAHMEPLPDGLTSEEQLAEIDRRIHTEQGKGIFGPKTAPEIETPEMRTERRERERQDRAEARERARAARQESKIGDIEKERSLEESRTAEKSGSRVENTVLLDEGVRQFLMDVSAVRKANIEALIENNPALKRFVAPESYVKDEIVPGQNVTVLGLAAEITFKYEAGEDFTPSLAIPLDGPARGVQAALREQNDPREVVKIAETIVDVMDAPFEYEGPDYSEPDFAKKVISTRSPEERDELVNGEMRGDGLPLQIALAYIDDSKRDKVCIESLKGYGIDTQEIEKDLGLVQEPAKPSINPPKMSPREIEMAHAETLSSEIVEVNNPELEQEPDLTITREQSRSREI